MAYHLTGALSALIFLLTLGGLWSQLRLVWKRKARAEKPTAILSLNQFISSFLAFFSFFLYGACLTRFNHYLVWPRLIATWLVLTVLFEIMIDRRNRPSRIAFATALTLLLCAPFLLLLQPHILHLGRLFSQALIVVVTVVLAQGYTHQIVLIRESGHTGAVSIRMHQFFLGKDLSTIAFALTMGFQAGWPLLLLSGVSALTKLATIWHFRWARLSPLAQSRRNQNG